MSAKQINLNGINISVNKNNDNVGGNITTADSITASGNIIGNNITSNSGGMIIKSGTTDNITLYENGNITTNGDITIPNNKTINCGKLVANYSTSIQTSGNIISSRNITANSGTITGNILSSNTTINAGGDITTSGSITASSGIISGNVLSSTTTINSGGNITSGGNISANSGTISGNALSSNTTINAGGNITTSGGNITASSGTISGNALSSTTTISAGGDITTTGSITANSTSSNITTGKDLNAKNLYIGCINNTIPYYGRSYVQFTGSRINDVTNLLIKTSDGVSANYNYDGIINTGNISANGNITTNKNITASSGVITGKNIVSNEDLTCKTNINAEANLYSTSLFLGKKNNSNPVSENNSLSKLTTTLNVLDVHTRGNVNNWNYVNTNTCDLNFYNHHLNIYSWTTSTNSRRLTFYHRNDNYSMINNIWAGAEGVGSLRIYYRCVPNGGSNSNRHLNYFENEYFNGISGHYLNIGKGNTTSWYKISTGSATSKPTSTTIIHSSVINGSLNDYIIGQPIFLNNNYYTINFFDNYDQTYSEFNLQKINIDKYTYDKTIFDITNIPNNNFVGICVSKSEEVIVNIELDEKTHKYFFDEISNEKLIELNLDINNLPENYKKLYKWYDLKDINKKDYNIYTNLPFIAFATHGDYMFYVNDTEALIDTNLNTQKHYEIGDELTYDGKILILPEFNPNDNLTETQQLQELINYNKQMSNYNKLKKNSIGKISHIFTQQECDDYKHYLAVFKSN